MLNDPPKTQHESLLYIYKRSDALKQSAARCSHVPNQDGQMLGTYKHYSIFLQKV